MKAVFACMVPVLLASCSAPSPKIDTIEIHRSGEVGYNVIIHANGTGEFEGSPGLPEEGKRSFTLQQGQFEQLASAIRPYIRYARPATDASIRDVVRGTWPECPKDKGHTMDAGALYVRWQGPKTNIHYLVDFGCDYEANLARNQRPMKAVHRLPISQYVGPLG